MKVQVTSISATCSTPVTHIQPVQLYNVIWLFLPNCGGGNSNPSTFAASLAVSVAEGENNE